ncbi:hypothetical protein Trydic_g1988 [Trypoxylus dichotomus]
MLYTAPVWADAFRVKESRKLIVFGILLADIWARELAKQTAEEIIAEIPGRKFEIHPSETGAIKFSREAEGDRVQPNRITLYMDGRRRNIRQTVKIRSGERERISKVRSGLVVAGDPIGYGNFGALLHRIGRRDNANCGCGAEDTAGHVLFNCPYMKVWRARREEVARIGDKVPSSSLVEGNWKISCPSLGGLASSRRTHKGTTHRNGSRGTARYHVIQSRAPEWQTLTGCRRISPRTVEALRRQ